ncbi:MULTISPECIES: SdpI family protein [Burkholderia]|uniref:SdpI family protein n=1 Tax=Burkholderia mayonis TaxID=1385591 RepID=A0A1B4FE66_9BURK|nr:MULTISPECIES: SdpI family protein [Burkholderia]AOJ01929.1 hypothetical protein WS70_08900 [Burkholderia mayonis]KVE39641.1 hypothetical protein WS69_07245 [Burkholderia sp. BDU5]KVE40389.1 hypothetical protein WS70_17960 [Burkholderia mayonis]
MLVPYLLASALFFLLAVPLAAKRIGPNRFYGVRTRATLRDAALWYRRNWIFGLALMLTSTVFIIVIGYCRLRGARVPNAVLLAAFVAEIAIPAGLCFISPGPPGDHPDRGRR